MTQTAERLIEIIYLGTKTTQRPGGQHAGVPASAIRVTHIPTGIMAQCGEATSQHQNREIANEMVDWALACLMGSRNR